MNLNLRHFVFSLMHRLVTGMARKWTLMRAKRLRVSYQRAQSLNHNYPKGIATRASHDPLVHKIFCIGFMKTGTTSFGEAMKALGFKHTSFNEEIWHCYQDGNLDEVLEYMKQYDSADDLPWLNIEMIPILDREFPGSKFVFLDRDEDSWLNSYSTWTFKMTGSYPSEAAALNSYRTHREFVFDYFKHSRNFISLNVAEPGSLNELRVFLGFAPSNKKFPVLNRTADL